MSLSDRLKYVEMRSRHQKTLRPWYKKTWGILLITFLIFLVIFFITSFVYVYQEVKKIKSEGSELYQEQQKEQYFNLIHGSNNYAFGAIDPKITIVEFTDFACPFCRQSALELTPLLRENYKDNIRFIVRDFPLHENSIDLAVAMRCAGEQGKYWPAHDLIFQEQNLLGDTGELLKVNLLAWAEILSLDLDRFENCFDERRYVNLVRRDYEDGLTLNIQGTPTWFINSTPLTGYYPIDDFEKLIDNILLNLESQSD